jgi:DNA mismatch endonuclease (patch repair protein)
VARSKNPILLEFWSVTWRVVYGSSVTISSLSGLIYDLELIATENGALDTVSPDQRSRNMAAIKGKNTRPELRVRRFLHRRGLRYRLHVPGLPGTPDLVFHAKRAVVFVHGCFWHQCPHCRVGSRGVKSNTGYWLAKLKRNQTRDVETKTALRTAGWKVFIVWECQVGDETTLTGLAKALDQPSSGSSPFTASSLGPS